MSSPIKIVWLCHFSNDSIRHNLELCDMSFENRIRELFGFKKKQYIDFAPWVTNSIIEFEDFKDDIELHIVSPHRGMKHQLQEFSHNGIFYHFFRSEPLFPFSYLYKLLRLGQLTGHFLNRRAITSFVKQVRPTLINLIGAENPYYSSGVLGINDIPILLSCQTIYSNPDRKRYQETKINSYRWKTEHKIFEHVKYYACTGRRYYDLIHYYEPNATVFPFQFPVERLEVKQIPKKFDFVWFAANVSEKKGIIEAIKATAIVKAKHHKVTLLIVGSCSFEMMSKLEKIIVSLNLSNNIKFHEFFPNHTEMLEYITQAKYALLPIKMDLIPGTVTESMALGLPVVTTKTAGTPLLNKNAQCVLFSDIGDSDGLARNMCSLFDSSELASSLAINAKKWVDDNLDNTKNCRRLIIQYKSIINNYYNGEAIKKELLFNVDDYPEYK